MQTSISWNFPNYLGIESAWPNPSPLRIFNVKSSNLQWPHTSEAPHLNSESMRMMMMMLALDWIVTRNLFVSIYGALEDVSIMSATEEKDYRLESVQLKHIESAIALQFLQPHHPPSHQTSGLLNDRCSLHYKDYLSSGQGVHSSWPTFSCWPIN